ncbi:STAS domain-containing protein [Amycolatopsis sp. ATCC 39116]|uniref:STAS domain-containing protein n=1 Tax=Amycolatopsis sp. (strain ATCC 39116 / 75iv2) TaxID=385957 RepID=UPI00037AEA7B|nr:STAS domain-containing protein [Amycolatopsis sp. ATCC 39116]
MAEHGAPGGGPGREQLRVGVDVLDREVVVRVAGDVDLESATHLEQALTESAERIPPVLVVDLTGVEYFGSAGMRVLVGLQQRCGGATRVRVVASDQRVLRPLEITGLTELLDIYPTVADALR